VLCPYCGQLDGSIRVKEYTHSPHVLGKCRSCGEEVYAVGTRKDAEESRLTTVSEGERKEELFADLFVEELRGDSHRDRGKYSDIDREILDESNNTVLFVEFKQRSCSLNGYRKTKFPYAKIKAGKELNRETGIPVYIVLKFIDAWTFISVTEGDERFEEGGIFTPNYRGEKAKTEYQRSVEIPVSELRVLPLDDYCMTADEIQRDIVN